MTDILVPTEQEGTKAVVKTWLKKVGDGVKVDDPIVELETDKVAVEVADEGADVAGRPAERRLLERRDPRLQARVPLGGVGLVATVGARVGGEADAERKVA